MNCLRRNAKKDEDGIIRLTSRAKGTYKTTFFPPAVRPTEFAVPFPSPDSGLATFSGPIPPDFNFESGNPDRESVASISPIDVPKLSSKLQKLREIRHQLVKNMTSSCSSGSIRTTESSSDEREIRITLNDPPDKSEIIIENQQQMERSEPPVSLPMNVPDNNKRDSPNSSPVKTKFLNLVRRASSKEKSPILKRMFSTDSRNNTSNTVPTSPLLNKPIKGHVRQASDFDMNRVHEELEKLNIATDVINKLELQLDDARNAFREIQSSWSSRLETMGRKLGDCVQKSRPYYEAQIMARQIQDKAQDAVLKFERANSMHQVAKQQVALTQESLSQNPKNVDPACLEVLNHHIQRVNEAESERVLSEEEHRKVSSELERANIMLRALEADLKRSIKKSRPYFESRLEFTRVLEEQKKLVERLQKEIRQKKMDYQTSLKNLERISDQIHADRAELGIRGQGVGEETPLEKRRQEKVEEGPRPLPYLDLDRERAHSVPAEFDVDTPSTARSITPAGLQSGIVLLAQQLQQYGWIADERKSRAFSYPPEDVNIDLQYKTTPKGVKPFPTPPTSPPADPVQPNSARTVSSTGCLQAFENPSELERASASAPQSVRSSARTRRHVEKSILKQQHTDSDSPTSSLASLALDEEKLNAMLRSHTDLINEIEHKAQMEDCQLGDRGSASGESL